MRCPQCQNHEPDGSTTCRMCFAALAERPPAAGVVRQRSRATAAVRTGAGPGLPRVPVADVWGVAPDRGAEPRRPSISSATAGLPALQRRVDPVAIAAFVTGLCVLGPIAMVLGLWGRHRVHSHVARRGYALASVGLWFGLAATLAYFWLLVDRGGSTLGPR